MTDPATMEDYTRLFTERATVTGFGVEVCQHAPCPFCAAPDWQLWHIAHGIAPGDARPTLAEQMATDTTCRVCGRTAHTENEEPEPGTHIIYTVQTAGPDAPPWLTGVRDWRNGRDA